MSKRAGAVSAETREGILRAAAEEFARCGFQGSSLRRICAAAGVTTGAVYFFFSGKDDLFRTVLARATEPFMALITRHYRGERRPSQEAAGEQADADFRISLDLIDCYFRNRTLWDILLAHQDHPAVRQFLEDFTEMSAEHYLYRIRMARKDGRQEVDAFAVHQFVHMQADTMLTLISHDFSREEMVAHARTMTGMLQAAFQFLLSASTE